ncbi:MAG: ribonuclease III [Robiginitomaculum sp.]|nr:MAG: ribonuclease III [Robiginitomaculum sp.]
MSSRLSEQAVQQRLGYQFGDEALLRRALTHGSYGDGRAVADNERLEFLGDRVLGLIVARHLFVEDPKANEGQMARRLNALVRKEACAEAACAADLGEALYLSKAEENNGGRNKQSILGDVCEAVLAALYLDGGMEPAQAFFDAFWIEQRARLSGSNKDPKSALQEWALAHDYGLPKYVELSRTGPDHQPEFHISVAIQDWKCEGRGNSKQNAERAAASKLFEQVVKK